MASRTLRKMRWLSSVGSASPGSNSLVPADHREELHLRGRDALGGGPSSRRLRRGQRLDDTRLEAPAPRRILQQGVQHRGELRVTRIAAADVGHADGAALELDRAAGDGHLAHVEPGARCPRPAPHHHQARLGPPQHAMARRGFHFAPACLELVRRRLRQDRHPAAPRLGRIRHFCAASFLAVSLRSRITWYLPSSAGTKPPSHAPISLNASGLRARIVVRDSRIADLKRAGRYLRTSIGSYGLSIDPQITRKPPGVTLYSRVSCCRSGKLVDAISTFLAATARIDASCEPENVTFEKCFLGSTPGSIMKNAEGTR